MLGHLLVEFLFRLTFGIAVAMSVTSSRWVTSGFFRVHLWVLLGLQTLAALALYSATTSSAQMTVVPTTQFWLAVTAAIGSYVGAVIWMYEKATLGKIVIAFVAGCALVAFCLPAVVAPIKPVAMQLADNVTSGLLLGLVTTAMLLGHWYLNTPTMKLAPLKRLISLLVIAGLLRAAVSMGGTWLVAAEQYSTHSAGLPVWPGFIALRWVAGLLSVLLIAWLTWQTLKIPNTQSATGLLYAGVVLAFIGELTSQLISARTIYPI